MARRSTARRARANTTSRRWAVQRNHEQAIAPYASEVTVRDATTGKILRTEPPIRTQNRKT